jgi:hypothetical protein
MNPVEPAGRNEVGQPEGRRSARTEWSHGAIQYVRRKFKYEMIGQFVWNSGIIKVDDPDYWKIMQAGEGKEYHDAISNEKKKVLGHKTCFKRNYL